MTLRSVTLIAFALAVMAQDAPAPKQQGGNGAISGVVRDAGTGVPLADVTIATTVSAQWVNNTIVMSATSHEVSTTSDAQGHYRLGDLPAGQYRVTARPKAALFPNAATKTLTVAAGQETGGIDFHITGIGAIAGKVTDQYKEPVPGLTVMLISREYFLGAAHYFVKDVAQTNDLGEYELKRAEAGHPYLVMAEKRNPRMDPLSDAPLDPKLRRASVRTTFYPNTPEIDGGMAVTVRPGERREGIDISLTRGPNFCISGTTRTGMGPAAMRFSIVQTQPVAGTSSGGGLYMVETGGMTGVDARFRICGPAPGEYRPSANGTGSPPAFGSVAVSIADRDVANVALAALPGLPLKGEVVWDGAPPDQPLTAKLSVMLQPLTRAFFMGENNNQRVDIPGTFQFPNVIVDSYLVRPFLNVPGVYVKDVTYGGRSVLDEPLRFGSASADTGLRVVLARDGATISAKVTDKDGNGVPDARVVLLPDAPSEAIVAARMVTGQTDHQGQYTFSTLRPGKYYALAVDQPVNATVDVISKLWRARSRSREVDLPPGGSAQLTLEVVELE